MAAQVPEKLMFKALVHEIWEIQPLMSAFEMLRWMCDDSRYLAAECEFFLFYHDDGQITEDEAFLLEWLRTMEQHKAEFLRDHLLDTAFALDEIKARG